MKEQELFGSGRPIAEQADQLATSEHKSPAETIVKQHWIEFADLLQSVNAFSFGESFEIDAANLLNIVAPDGSNAIVGEGETLLRRFLVMLDGYETFLESGPGDSEDPLRLAYYSALYPSILRLGSVILDRHNIQFPDLLSYDLYHD